MDSLVVLIEAHPALVALLIFLLGFAVSSAGSHFGSVSMREKLENRASWDALIARFSGGASAAYFGALDGVLGLATRVYGPRPLGAQAFARCLFPSPTPIRCWRF